MKPDFDKLKLGDELKYGDYKYTIYAKTMNNTYIIRYQLSDNHYHSAELTKENYENYDYGLFEEEEETEITFYADVSKFFMYEMAKCGIAGLMVHTDKTKLKNPIEALKIKIPKSVLEVK